MVYLHAEFNKRLYPMTKHHISLYKISQKAIILVGNMVFQHYFRFLYLY